MVGLLVRFVAFLAFGLVGSASLVARLGPEFDVVFWFLAVISAFGMEVAWHLAFPTEHGMELPSHSVHLYIPALFVGAALTATTVYAAPYAPYCEGIWKYINYFGCL